jgi:[ribosomal protein S5]-alanine N-acetyltransferase
MTPFNFTPFPTLSTDRLILRQMTMEDEQEIFQLRSDDRVLQFIEIAKAETVDDARKFIEKINTVISENESVMWAITLKDDDKLIGTICFWNIVAEAMEAEIGYMLHPGLQGKGLMQEAVIKVIDYGFTIMRLNTIVADLDPKNSRSLKILERTGFLYTGKTDELVVYSLKRDNGQ